MRTSFAYALLLALIATCGCHKGISPERAKERLVGRYNLEGSWLWPHSGGRSLESFHLLFGWKT